MATPTGLHSPCALRIRGRGLLGLCFMWSIFNNLIRKKHFQTQFDSVRLHQKYHGRKGATGKK